MHSEVVVFDIGGTWFRSGIFDLERGLLDFQREPAINYLSHPMLSADDLQMALLHFIVRRVHAFRDRSEHALQNVSISLGAPINAHDMTVLGSGPLWGPTAKPFHLQAMLHKAIPDIEWHLVNDITALLAPYMEDSPSYSKTLLITVSSGIGGRLYDHRTRRIPYDSRHGVQGEIGHLVFPFELNGELISRQCECGGWNHMNAFSSGRGIALTLRHLPSLSESYSALFSEPDAVWSEVSDEYRLHAFQTQLDCGNAAATSLLDAFVTPLVRALAAALAVDPDIDRIVITGGVAHGLGSHYRDALMRTFLQEGLYQITDRDPEYLSRRLHWDDPDDFAGLRGAGIYAARLNNQHFPLGMLARARTEKRELNGASN